MNLLELPAESDRLHLTMIDSLHIAGFKLFRDLTLPKLGRMNLFVGENNTGKRLSTGSDWLVSKSNACCIYFSNRRDTRPGA